MSDYSSAEEIRSRHITTMGQPIGEVYYELSNKLLWAHFNWNDYRALFAHPDTIALLNAAAPTFFWSLEKTMWDAVILHLCRLTDRPRISGHETLTLKRLPPLICNEPLKVDVQGLVDEALSRTRFARDWRNRRLAHTELPPEFGHAAEPLARASRQQVEDALQAMRQVLNRILLHYEGSTLLYEQFDSGPGGVQSALHILREGIESRRRHFLDAGVPDSVIPYRLP